MNMAQLLWLIKMLIINCPYCGQREQEEFSCGGEAHIERPKNPPDLNDDQWADYLFLRQNIKGLQYERWNHSFGCRQWFNVIRDTTTNNFLQISKPGENYTNIKNK